MLDYLHEISMGPDSQYKHRTERNLGIVTEAEQEHIRDARIAVLGTGGLGGPLALNLVSPHTWDVVDFQVQLQEILAVIFFDDTPTRYNSSDYPGEWLKSSSSFNELMYY